MVTAGGRTGQPGPLSIVGGTVVTGYGEPRQRDITIVDGRIARSADQAAVDRPDGADVLQAVGKLVLPGLVNAHDHLRSMLPVTRRGDTSGLAEMIRTSQLASALATPADYRALTAIAAARAVASGITTAVDHVYPLHRPGLLAAVVAGHADVGLRAHIGYGLLTEGPSELVGALDDQVAAAIAAADTELPAHRLYLAPVSLRQTSLEGYRAAVAAADRTGLRLYTHIAESTDEVEQCVARHGMRPVELLHHIGFLRPGTVIVHCVHLTDHEIELIAANSVAVAYCPSNHLRLAKGFAPVVAMRAAGVRVCLGVDGMDDMFTEMRQAVYAQGSAVGRTGALPSLDALAMATGEGATAIGEEATGHAPAGRLHAGERADLITVRTDFPSWQPLADPVQAFVHRGHGRDVADVLVDGEFVVRDGRLQGADLAELAERAWATTRDLARRSGREVDADWWWRPGATTYINADPHAHRGDPAATAMSNQ